MMSNRELFSSGKNMIVRKEIMKQWVLSTARRFEEYRKFNESDFYVSGERLSKTFERIIQANPNFDGTLLSLAKMNGFGAISMPIFKEQPKGEMFLNRDGISCFIVPKEYTTALHQWRFLLRNADDILLLLSWLDSGGIITFWYQQLDMYKYRFLDIDENIRDMSAFRTKNEEAIPISIGSLIQIVFVLYCALMLFCCLAFLLEALWSYFAREGLFWHSRS